MQAQKEAIIDSRSSLKSISSADILGTLEDYSDIASWLNDTIENQDGKDGALEEKHVLDLSELEKHVSQLSAVVEVACEDTSAQLEKTIDDVSRTVPRLTYDLQLMQESALSLQSSLHTVEQHSRSTLNSLETVPVLERLRFLDVVKRNMEASLAVLREAEAWSSLESEVMSYLGEQSYAKAASRLSEASKSLGVFENTPEFENRKTLLTNLQNQLEASLSSALVACINSNDVDACKKYFDIFCHIEREAEFRSYWNGSKRKGLLALWQDTPFRDYTDNPAEKNAQSTDRKFSAFVAEFFNELLSVLQIERQSVMLIFPDPQPTLSNFIVSTMSSLQPSLAQRLSTLCNYNGDLALPELIVVFKATEEFAVSTDKIMEKVGYVAPSPSIHPTSLDDKESSTPQRTHSRRQSQRQSFSRRLSRMSFSGTAPGLIAAQTGMSALDHSWDEALFEPFLDYQSEYMTLEKRLLRAQLNSLIASSSSSTGARLLRERAVDVLSFADESLVRCMSFTHGYGAVGLIQALDDLFETFLDSASNDILDANPTNSLDNNAFGSNDEFSELDYSSSDLATFQLVLHLLGATRAIQERLIVFESKLRASLVQVLNALKMSRNDPYGLYISGTTKGEMSLLQSSTLNTVELQALLDEVDPDQPQYHGQTPFTPLSASLQSQKHNSAQSRGSLLLGAKAAISNFANNCQLRLQATILAPLFKHLTAFRTLASWTAPEVARWTRGGGAISEVVMPTFSLSPSATIQHVAEGLLSLPRLFEVYADDDALAFSIETLPFVDEETLKAMATEFTQAASANEDSKQPDMLDPSRPRPRHLTSPSLSIKVLPPTQTQTPTLILTPEAVSSAWLASLALTLLSRLTGEILPSFPPLSSGGAAQLAEDLGYLSQIVKALNVEWEYLEVWRECVCLGEEELRKRFAQVKDEELANKSAILDTLKQICKLRGYSL